MKLKRRLYRIALPIATFISCILASCNCFDEHLPECRFLIQFKYDYNMNSADAFATQVNKVELYIFDHSGKFLKKQSEEGATLSTGHYRMEIDLPIGKYQIMAWAGAHDSYELSQLVPGVSTLSDLELKLKRESSLILDKELEPLWYGELKDVEFRGDAHVTEVVNLIKDTNKLRFIFQCATSDDNFSLNVDDYTYEIIESNGWLNHDNTLHEDDVLSFRPYYKEQVSRSAICVEINTMRLTPERDTRFVVTEKASGRKVFDINLKDYLLMTNMENHNWSAQEYLDRQDEYAIVFFMSESWIATQININGWTWYIQNE